MVKNQGRNRKKGGSDDVGPEDPVKTRAAAKNGDELGLLSHLGSEENNGNKNKEGTKKISVVGNEHQIIVKYYFFKRDVVCTEGWKFILYIKNYKNQKNECNRKKESRQEFPKNIYI